MRIYEILAGMILGTWFATTHTLWELMAFAAGSVLISLAISIVVTVIDKADDIELMSRKTHIDQLIHALNQHYSSDLDECSPHSPRPTVRDGFWRRVGHVGRNMKRNIAHFTLTRRMVYIAIDFMLVGAACWNIATEEGLHWLYGSHVPAHLLQNHLTMYTLVILFGAILPISCIFLKQHYTESMLKMRRGYHNTARHLDAELRSTLEMQFSSQSDRLNTIMNAARTQLPSTYYMAALKPLLQRGALKTSTTDSLQYANIMGVLRQAEKPSFFSKVLTQQPYQRLLKLGLRALVALGWGYLSASAILIPAMVGASPLVVALAITSSVLGGLAVLEGIMLAVHYLSQRVDRHVNNQLAACIQQQSNCIDLIIKHLARPQNPAAAQPVTPAERQRHQSLAHAIYICLLLERNAQDLNATHQGKNPQAEASAQSGFIMFLRKRNPFRWGHRIRPLQYMRQRLYYSCFIPTWSVLSVAFPVMFTLDMFTHHVLKLPAQVLHLSFSTPWLFTLQAAIGLAIATAYSIYKLKDGHNDNHSKVVSWKLAQACHLSLIDNHQMASDELQVDYASVHKPRGLWLDDEKKSQAASHVPT